MRTFRTTLLLVGLMAPIGVTQAYGYYGEGPYIGFSVGATNYDIAVRNWNEGSITSGSVDDNDVGVKFFWGYRLSNYLGFEVFYANLGETSFEGVSDGGGTVWAPGEVSGHTKNSGYGFSANATIPMGRHFDAFAKAGIFRWTVRERQFDSSGAFRFSDSGSDMMFGGGLSFNVTDQSSVRAEWERYTNIYDIYDIDMISLGFMHRF